MHKPMSIMYYRQNILYKTGVSKLIGPATVHRAGASSVGWGCNAKVLWSRRQLDTTRKFVPPADVRVNAASF